MASDRWWWLPDTLFEIMETLNKASLTWFVDSTMPTEGLVQRQGICSHLDGQDQILLTSMTGTWMDYYFTWQWILTSWTNDSTELGDTWVIKIAYEQSAYGMISHYTAWELCTYINHDELWAPVEFIQGAVSIRKTVLPGMAIPMLKIRRPNGRLIFNMEITIRR